MSKFLKLQSSIKITIYHRSGAFRTHQRHKMIERAQRVLRGANHVQDQ